MMLILRRIVSLVMVCLCIGLILSGCAAKGIKKLEGIDLSYYKALQKELEANEKPFASVWEATISNHQLAIQEAARFQGDLQAAKVVYSVREMLTAPGGSPEFIQVTRNKVILYYLADLAVAQNEKTAAELQLASERGKQLAGLERNLIACAKAVVSSEQALHNFLNQSTGANIEGIILEVQRQLQAFNDEIKKGDQANPAIKKLVEQGKAARDAIDKANEGLPSGS